MNTKFIRQLAQATYLAAQGKQKRELDEVAARVLSMLKARRMLNKSKEFFASLAFLQRAEERIVEATVESRHPLSQNELRAIKVFLKRRTRRDVELRVREQRDLLGGFRIRYDDVILDATIDAQLKHLALHLTS